jgi:hypothetical protein
MQTKKVWDIVRFHWEGVAPTPAVGLSDPVTRAVEVMLNHDLRSIAVAHNGQTVGMVRLEDALQCLGIAPGGHTPPLRSPL